MKHNPIHEKICRGKEPGTDKFRWMKFTGIGMVVAGICVVANGLVCGPNAYLYGRAAVAGMCITGLALMLAGADLLRKRQRASRRN
jgi:hypothetical protein